MSSTSCFTPRAFFSVGERLLEAVAVDRRRRPRRTSGSAAGTSRWRSARCRSLRQPSTASSFRPRLRIVSIIPGIETAAPERTETSNGSCGSPKRLPLFSSSAREVLVDLVLEPVGQLAARRHVRAARVGRDREARRHRARPSASSRPGRRPCRRAGRALRRRARRSRRRSARRKAESSHKCPAILAQLCAERQIVAMGGLPDDDSARLRARPRARHAVALRADRRERGPGADSLVVRAASRRAPR